MFKNVYNYGPYAYLLTNGTMSIVASSIDKNNWGDYFYSLLNIFKDGIETDFVKNVKVTVVFDKGTIVLSLPHLFFNLIFWRMPIELGIPITSKYIYYDCILGNITKNSIKNYIDNNIIVPNRKTVPNIVLNNIIDDALHEFKHINKFAMFFANNVNLQDDIDMMEKIPEYNSIIHADLSNTPISDIKDEGMKLTNKLIDYIKDSRKYLGYDHCLCNAFKSKESIKDRQYKESNVNIGSKPNGRGGIYPAIINKSFITGGVEDNLAYLIESSSGRIAQILSKKNVGTSGSFARILGLNNMDTRLHNSPDFTCNTKNFIKFEVKNKKILERIVDRYYRMTPDGLDRLIEPSDTFLIGQTILLRSPVTCASAAAGQGICYKCYGDLAFAVNMVNIGKYAAEAITSKLTQILLSAKHLLETNIKAIEWSDYFFEIFDIDTNTIKLNNGVNYKNFNLIINIDDINSDDSEEESEECSMDFDCDEYITSMIIESKDGKIREVITSKTEENLYISDYLSKLLKSKGEITEDKITLPLSAVDDSKPLFFVEIHNNELSQNMENIKNLLNKKDITKNMDKDQLVQAYIEALIEGKLDPMSIHGEVLIMNQIRAVDDILAKPDWEYPNAPYQILTLDHALMNNPSVTITLLYQKLSKILTSPKTFEKTAPSIVDPFFMEKPQDFFFTDAKLITTRNPKSDKEQNLIKPFVVTNVPESDNALV